MVEQGVLFNAEQLPSNRFQPEGSGRDIGYLRDVIPVVDALGAQLGQTDDETSGYFRIALKPGGNFLSPRWGGEDARGEVTITTRNFRGRAEYNLSHFIRSGQSRSDRVFEGFLMAVGRDPYDQRIYGVFYADCTDTEPSMVAVDLLDVEGVYRYSEAAQVIMAMYQNATVDGDTSCYPRARRENWREVFSADQMQHIIDRYWPEPELVYSATH